MHSMVYVTAPSREEALRVSRHLLEERLVACANLFPVHSLYWWEGSVEEAEEWVAIMKTRRDLAAKAVEAVHEVHAYDVPCAVAYDTSVGSEPYLDWIDSETRPR